MQLSLHLLGPKEMLQSGLVPHQMFPSPAVEAIVCQPSQTGTGKSFLRPIDDLPGEPTLCKSSKDALGDVSSVKSSDLRADGLPIRPFDEPIIQEGDAQFQRGRHAHLVGLHEQVLDQP